MYFSMFREKNLELITKRKKIIFLISNYLRETKKNIIYNYKLIKI